MKNRNVDWVRVRYEDVSQSKAPRKKGVSVHFMVSPLDVPDMWRHSVRETADGGQEFVCEFKYLATKEAVRSFEKDGVSLSVGKNSRRVYRIAVPLPSAPQDGDELELKIELAIEEIQSLKNEVDYRTTHWNVIKGMLQQPNLAMQ